MNLYFPSSHFVLVWREVGLLLCLSAALLRLVAALNFDGNLTISTVFTSQFSDLTC